MSVATNGLRSVKPALFDEQVHRPVQILQPLLDRTDTFRRHQICRQHLDTIGVHGPDLSGDAAEPLDVPRHQDQVVAVRGELAGE